MPEVGHVGSLYDWQLTVALLLTTAAGLAPWLGSRAVTAALVTAAAASLVILQWDTNLLVIAPWIPVTGILEAVLLPVGVALAVALAVMRLLCRRTAPGDRNRV
jgi:hypothetical protein